MPSSTGRTMLKLAGAVCIVAASFWISLKALDYWSSSETPNADEMQEPAYNAASLPHLSPGQTLAFAGGQNKNALLSGWVNVDPGGFWSIEHTAFIGFVVDGGAAPKQAIVHGGSYFVAGKLTEQRVQVWSGGRKLGEYDLKGTNTPGPDVALTIPLDRVAAATGTPVILRFDLPDAKSPQEVENRPDGRPFALYLKSLQILP